MISRFKTISVPFHDAIAGMLRLNPSWERFFQSLIEVIAPIGLETNYDLANNKSVAEELKGLQFDKTRVNFVSAEYYIKRVHANGASSQALVETGFLHIYYNPGSDLWGIRKIENGPSASGVTFSITSDGVVKYTSSNIAGTMTLFRLTLRTMSMKSLTPGNFKVII